MSNSTFFGSKNKSIYVVRPRVEDTEIVRSDERLGVRKAEQVGKLRFLKKVKQVNDHLMKGGKSLLYPKLSRGITTKLVSKCNGECDLTLRQKSIRHCLHKAEVRVRSSSSNEKQEFWTYSTIRLRRLIHQVDLAMKLVSSPLHHTQVSGPLTKEEEKMSSFEESLIIAAMRKMPPGLKKLLLNELMEQFGPSFDVFVGELVSNITMQLFMQWHKHVREQYHYVHLNYINAYSLTEKALIVDLAYMFQLVGVSRPQDVVKALVKKIGLGFLEAASTEDKLILHMHKMSLADVQVDSENAST